MGPRDCLPSSGLCHKVGNNAVPLPWIEVPKTSTAFVGLRFISAFILFQTRNTMFYPVQRGNSRTLGEFSPICLWLQLLPLSYLSFSKDVAVKCFKLKIQVLSTHYDFLGLIPMDLCFPLITNLIYWKNIEIATKVNFPNVAPPDVDFPWAHLEVICFSESEKTVPQLACGGS